MRSRVAVLTKISLQSRGDWSRA